MLYIVTQTGTGEDGTKTFQKYCWKICFPAILLEEILNTVGPSISDDNGQNQYLSPSALSLTGKLCLDGKRTPNALVKSEKTLRSTTS